MRKALIIILAIPLVVWLGWRSIYPSYEFQGTLTIRVMTPDGVVETRNTGRALFTQGPSFGLVDGASGGWKYWGEAPVIDLGEGRYLFAKVGPRIDTVFRSADLAGFMDTGDRWQNVRKVSRSRNVVWDVPEGLMPTLITFRDQNDITTAEIVDPLDLAATFGPGYELLGMTVEVTDEPTTRDQIAPLFAEWILDGWHGFRIVSDDGTDQFRINGAVFWQNTSFEAYEMVQNGDF